GKIIVLFCLSAYSFLVFTGCVKSNIPTTTTNTNTLKSVIASSSNATLLDTALTRAGLDSIYTYGGPFTFFVATDQAFLLAGITPSIFDSLPDSLLKKIILYNTLYPAVVSSQLPVGPDAAVITNSGDSVFITNNGTGAYINGIQIESFDLSVNNGLIDAVAQLVLPPAGTIMQIVQTDTSFSYFAAAVARTSAGETSIGNVLSDGNIFTVFLPDNDAFRAAGYTTTADISAADPDTLARVLQYHILLKRAFTSDFITAQSQQTLLANNTVTIGLVGGGIYAVKGNSNASPSVIIASNIMAHNGVIQVIGQLLTP
ncbi:MAG TPA: fasciclin domain-containing protein, partial [Puia sp.]